MTRRTHWTIGASILLLVIIAASVVYLCYRDYSDYFRRTKGRLVGVALTSGSGDGVFSHHLVTLRSDSGLKVECGLLVPKNEVPNSRYPAVILLGGVATGKRAVDYVTDISDVIVVSPDYQYKPRELYTAWQFIEDAPAMRQAAFEVVPTVMLLIDYLAGRPDVDPKRIILVGYSFGAPFVPCIAAEDRRPAAAVMVFGGGDLRGMIRHNVRSLAGDVRSELVGLLGAVLLRPLEPTRYADLISPMPLLMINGTRDREIPKKYVEEFYQKAKQPKKLIWLDAPHVNPRNVQLTSEIIGTLRKELTDMKILSAGVGYSYFKPR